MINYKIRACEIIFLSGILLDISITLIGLALFQVAELNPIGLKLAISLNIGIPIVYVVMRKRFINKGYLDHSARKWFLIGIGLSRYGVFLLNLATICGFGL
jgi:hypothetical protein